MPNYLTCRAVLATVFTLVVAGACKTGRDATIDTAAANRTDTAAPSTNPLVSSDTSKAGTSTGAKNRAVPHDTSRRP
jgi:hypothetical protein